ncbi:TetR/AcrR family transcriptional regulator [Photorhabdus luminescens]|uniref:TetR/AcrR family transcriptional regulator n=1 Tax=Photorhabdus luminescens TaxID=29488 RepID=UPI00223F8828|nr:TetR-like C-terminal domain-containing protein [Photorhabdus luminescens]MCW7764060.1 TetR/AcrR family transcriptional regulator C-terminal ligand-binding domain-containing protein [Photorhabdus luminescens subsp. venezuelensis]
MSENERLSLLRRGRPRDNDTTRTVLSAALVLAESGRIADITINHIALYSGVAKSTIYRRWPNVSAVLMDAFFDDIEPLIIYDKQIPVIESMRVTIKKLIEVLQSKRGLLFRYLLGSAQYNAEVREVFVQRWLEPRRQLGKQIILHAIERGEISSNADSDLLLDCIFGAIYYKYMVSFSPITPEFVDKIIDCAFGGLVKN